MKQITFDADELAAFASGHSGKNVLITMDKTGIKATIVSKPNTVSAMDTIVNTGSLDGCPFPPGCI